MCHQTDIGQDDGRECFLPQGEFYVSCTCYVAIPHAVIKLSNCHISLKHAKWQLKKLVYKKIEVAYQNNGVRVSEFSEVIEERVNFN